MIKYFNVLCYIYFEVLTKLVKKMSPKNYSRRAVSKLLNCLSEEIEKQQPKNVIHFMVDFLCKNYGSHLRGFAHVWDVVSVFNMHILQS
ncbi:hypothetical protein PFFVO_02364 [Plasmodium falciparum Vietnam Oak-Knoll (FVO)]|uniref:Uncharacterized protein n=1 Tax=Plasmodium falciparum Vietnam Oak-Knoll (FVO) TaxID=1036723 RepID=A0A024V7K3_PLAFA|nr:hypothetical protein PFFVO_02364 [Plasmodium falciparum Vietnam Oak-Knoll (FVO)]